MINKIKAIIEKDLPLVTNLANVAAILNEMQPGSHTRARADVRQLRG